MNRHRKKVSLAAFLKGSADPKKNMPGCSNYDQEYDGCIREDARCGDDCNDPVCSVMSGQRCEYFEKTVLPAASENELYEVLAEYQETTGTDAESNLIDTNARRCPECGKLLLPRRRFCDDCVLEHRRKTKRESQSRYRQKQRLCA